jgi:hypothetical protein
MRFIFQRALQLCIGVIEQKRYQYIAPPARHGSYAVEKNTGEHDRGTGRDAIIVGPVFGKTQIASLIVRVQADAHRQPTIMLPRVAAITVIIIVAIFGSVITADLVSFPMRELGAIKLAEFR